MHTDSTSDGMKKQMASSDLNFDHLNLAYMRGDMEGARRVYSERFNG